MSKFNQSILGKAFNVKKQRIVLCFLAELSGQAELNRYFAHPKGMDYRYPMAREIPTPKSYILNPTSSSLPWL